MLKEDRAVDATRLISLIVVGTHGFENIEDDLRRLIDSLRYQYAFFEILLIGASDDRSAHEMVHRLGRLAPQIRFLQIEGAVDFDRMAMHGYQECIGDLIILSSADEVPHLGIDPIITRLRDGEELVRLRRKRGSALERLGSLAVRFVTGLDVDTRFLRVLGINRQLLSELLARPEEIHLFRFTAHTLFARQTTIETENYAKRGGLRLQLRRLDLVARLVATAAPRLLRACSFLCLLLSGAAFLTLFYVVGVWLFRKEIVEGWTTMISLLATWMFVQLMATSALCLGLSRFLDRQERVRMPRLVDEMTVSDLFASSGLLNVEAADVGTGAAVPRPTDAARRSL